MTGRDEFYNKAKQQGYRSRAAYKLKQLDDLENVISGGDTVVDLGPRRAGGSRWRPRRSAPRSVIGVDLQRIKDLEDEDLAARVETIRGDMTQERTRERVVEAAGGTAGSDTDEVGRSRRRSGRRRRLGHGTQRLRRVLPRPGPVAAPRAPGVRDGTRVARLGATSS